jgi:hypothetical protein
MFFSKSIPISKSGFDHKKSMAKNQSLETKEEERLPGRNFERGAKKGRNYKPNQTTAPKSRKKRRRSHKRHSLD